MKYRIKQINEVYYPQYRSFFIWNNFITYAEPNFFPVDLCFSYLSEAEEYIDRRKSYDIQSKIKPIVKIYEIKG